MVNVIGRKPIHAANRGMQTINDSLAYVIPGEFCVGLLRPAHRSDEACSALTFHSENYEKIGLLESDVHVCVHRWPASLHVGNVEQMLVGSTRKSAAQHPAPPRVSAVTASHIGGRARFHGAVGLSDPCAYLVVGFGKRQQFGFSFDRYARVFQYIKQQAFVLVLLINERIWIWTHSFAHATKINMGCGFPVGPNIRLSRPTSLLDNQIRETKLAIKLQGASLHGQGARGCSRPRRLVQNTS